MSCDVGKAALSMSQLILQPFFRFSYVTGFSLTSPGEPPMVRRKWKEETPPTPPPLTWVITGTESYNVAYLNVFTQGVFMTKLQTLSDVVEAQKHKL